MADELNDTLTRLATIVDYVRRDMEEIRVRLRDEFVTVREAEGYRAELARFDRLMVGFDQRLADNIGRFETAIWKRLDAGDKRLDAVDKRLELIQELVRQEAAKSIGDLKKELEKYVTKEEHTPVKQIAFGAVGVIVLAVLGALVALVVRGGAS